MLGRLIGTERLSLTGCGHIFVFVRSQSDKVMPNYNPGLSGQFSLDKTVDVPAGMQGNLISSTHRVTELIVHP